MKTTIVIVLGSFISMLAIAGTFFVLYSTNPAAFGGVAAADSTQVPMSDSLFAAMQGKDSLSAVNSVTNAAHGDSAKHETAPVPAPVAAAKNTPPATPVVQKDTTDWKSKAKLLEAMSIESASSILQVMNDKDVKQIIPYIKKRNAAKILASFDPDRAARIIR